MPDRSDPSLSPSNFWPRPGRPNPVEQDIHCPDCGYNLRGLADPTCPECGRKVDIHFMTKPALPWMHHRAEGRFTAFYATASIVCTRPSRLAEQLWERGPLSRKDSRLFALFAGLHGAAIVAPAAALAIIFTDPADTRRYPFAALAAALVALWLWRGITATPRFVRKLTMSSVQLRRAELLSHYASAPLITLPGLLPLALIAWQASLLRTTQPVLADAVLITTAAFAAALLLFITAWPMVYLYLILAAQPLELLMLWLTTTLARTIELALAAALLHVLWNAYAG
jgi:hypothetical protein